MVEKEEKENMRNYLFFIIILILSSLISLPTIFGEITQCDCVSWGDCFPYGSTFCDTSGTYSPTCIRNPDYIGVCHDCRTEGQTCYINLDFEQCCSGECVSPYVQGSEPGSTETGTQGHCCPVGSVWGGDGCIKLTVTPPSRDFGIIEIGSCSSTKNFDVSNTGTGTLSGSASVSAPFSCTSGCDYTLSGGQSKTVGIQFCPTSAVSYSRTVSFTGGEGALATVTGTGEETPIIYYTLTVSKSGTGSGTVTGPGINCGSDCSESYREGTSVTLTASAGTGSTFAGWSGACSGTGGSCTVVMNSAKTVTATFNSVPPGESYTLAVSKSGTGSGTVTSSPAGINCGSDCNEIYSEGTSVSLYANADQDSTFTGWSGACSGTGSCTVVMNSYKSVTATFTYNVPPPPAECDLTSANWEFTEVEEGTTVGMDVEGNDCAGEALSFDIYRSSTYITTNYDVFPSSSWRAEPASSTPYYFISKVVDNPSESVTSDNLLVTSGGGPPQYCEGVVLCSHYINAVDCNTNVCEIDVQESLPGIDCSNPDIHCECIWDDNECKASWSGGGGGYCGDNTINPGETCDGSDWGSITGCSDFNDFTSGILACTDCQFDTSSCLGGTSGVCGDGNINPGETCDGNDWGPKVTGCSYFNDFTGGTLSCGTDCLFDTSECISPFGNGTEAGTCIYTQYSDDNCDDGFLTFSWTVTWEWNPDCDVICQQENQDLILQCVDGQKTVECPAQIPLPFFNIYSFIATLIIIVIVYVVMNSSKRKR